MINTGEARSSATTAKNEAMRDWCERVAASTGAEWCYRRVNQTDLDGGNWSRLSDLPLAFGDDE